jgi:hypothetical protein
MQPAEQHYSLEKFARRHSISLRTMYSEINAGRLTARKIGRRTVIPIDDAKACIERLPKVQPRAVAEFVASGGGVR